MQRDTQNRNRDSSSASRDTESVTPSCARGAYSAMSRCHAVTTNVTTAATVTARLVAGPSPSRLDVDVCEMQELGGGACFQVEPWVSYSEDGQPWIKVRLVSNGRRGSLSWSPRQMRFSDCGELLRMRRHAPKAVRLLDAEMRRRSATKDRRFDGWLAGATAEQQAAWEERQKKAGKA